MTPDPPPPPAGRFPALDGLRGIAIIMVTIFHLWCGAGHPAMHLYRGIDITGFFELGPAAARFFFALSGFCLFYPVLKDNNLSYGRFVRRRLLRILPAHILAMLVWLGIYGIGGNWQGVHWQFWTHLFCVHNFFPSTVLSFNPVLWFLGTLVHFYLLFPILARCVRRWPFTSYALSLVVGLAVNFAARHSGTYGLVLALSLPGCIFDFTNGMLAAWLVLRFPHVTRRLTSGAWLSGALVVLYLSLNPTTVYSITLRSPIWASVIAAAAISTSGLGRKICTLPVFTFMGTISFSLYIYNSMIWAIPFHCFPEAVPGSLQWLGIATVGVFASGVAGYYVAEWPFMALRRYVFKHRHALALPDSTMALSQGGNAPQ